MDSLEHEALCQRCGISCRAAVPVGDGRSIVLEDLHCPFLVDDSCSVYEDRFTKAPWCLHANVAGPIGALRQGCPYSRGQPGKVLLTEEQYTALWPKIRAALLAQKGVDPNFTWSKFFRAAEKRDPGYRWFLELSAARTTGRVRRRRKRWTDKLLRR